MGNTFWRNGKCFRGHDITNPDNVEIMWQSRKGEQVRRRNCIPCKSVVDTDLFPPRKCDHCGKTYHRKDNRSNAQAWRQRRYCDEQCHRKAARKRASEKARQVPGPLPFSEVVRLQEMLYRENLKDKLRREKLGLSTRQEDRDCG